MMIMGGQEFAGWFEMAGKGAGIQTFHGYGNGAKLAPQIAKFGWQNVFVSTGIPCGCCGSDGPKVKPVTTAEATGYIADELSQLNTSYVDLLLFHHRCDTPAETAVRSLPALIPGRPSRRLTTHTALLSARRCGRRWRRPRRRERRGT